MCAFPSFRPLTFEHFFHLKFEQNRLSSVTGACAVVKDTQGVGCHVKICTVRKWLRSWPRSCHVLCHDALAKVYLFILLESKIFLWKWTHKFNVFRWNAKLFIIQSILENSAYWIGTNINVSWHILIFSVIPEWKWKQAISGINRGELTRQSNWFWKLRHWHVEFWFKHLLA